jgi:hypothetical protein
MMTSSPCPYSHRPRLIILLTLLIESINIWQKKHITILLFVGGSWKLSKEFVKTVPSLKELFWSDWKWDQGAQIWQGLNPLHCTTLHTDSHTRAWLRQYYLTYIDDNTTWPGIKINGHGQSEINGFLTLFFPSQFIIIVPAPTCLEWSSQPSLKYHDSIW